MIIDFQKAKEKKKKKQGYLGYMIRKFKKEKEAGDAQKVNSLFSDEMSSFKKINRSNQRRGFFIWPCVIWLEIVLYFTLKFPDTSLDIILIILMFTAFLVPAIIQIFLWLESRYIKKFKTLFDVPLNNSFKKNIIKKG